MASRLDPGPRSLSTIGAICLLLLLGSLLVEVQVVIVRPGIGDVTDMVRAAWQLSVGAATVGSFLFAAYRFSSAKRGDSTGGLDIRGHNHDIDVHLHLGDVANRVRLTDRPRTDVAPEGTEPSDEGVGGDGEFEEGGSGGGGDYEDGCSSAN